MSEEKKLNAPQRAHLCFGREVESRPQDREGEVLDQIRTYGGFAVFWATQNHARATAIDRLQRGGRIVRKGDDPRDAFPWAVYEIAGEAVR